MNQQVAYPVLIILGPTNSMSGVRFYLLIVERFHDWVLY